MEEEEETVLPAIRQYISEDQQLEMARRLLFDLDSEDDCRMLDWIAPHLTDAERQMLADLVARFESTPQPLPNLPIDCGETPGESSTLGREIDVPSNPMSFDHPIDVMVLIHKALSAEAWRAETIAERLDIGEDLQPFLHAFNSWMKALSFHADMEDVYMTPLLLESLQARENEATHARLAQRVEEI